MRAGPPPRVIPAGEAGMRDTEAYARAHADLTRPGLLSRALEPGHGAYRPGLSGVWLRRPLVLAALCLLAGDLMGLGGGIPLKAWLLLAALAGAGALAGTLARRPRAWALLICVVMLGGVLGASVMERPAVPEEGAHYIEGRVRSVVKSDDEKLVLDVDRFSADGAAYRGGARLTLYLPEGQESLALPAGLEIGARVSLFGECYEPQGARGEGGFDYRAYLARRGVYSCAWGELAGARFEPTGTLPLANWAYGLKQRILGALDAELGEDAALARGVMLGDSAALPDELYESFRLAGLAHILAVSGMHVSMMALLICWLLRTVPGWLRTALTAALLLMYCALTGFSHSAVRAAVMSTVMIAARQAGLRYDGPSALALAAVIVLAAAPGAALDTGFALSFGAVLSIYALYPALRERLPRVRPGLRGEAAPLGAVLKCLCGAANALIESTALSLCVVVGTLPITSGCFGHINLVGVLTSAVGILAGMVTLVAGWLTVLLAGWAEPLARAAALVTGECARIMAALADWTAGLDWGIVYVRAISPWWLMAIAPLMLGASCFRPLGRAWRGACAVLTVGLICLLLLPPRAGSGLDYVLVDVGQGDGALFTDGASAVIVDVGGEDSALCDYVRRRGLRVEAVVITHLHEDHAGALEELARMARIGSVYLPESAEAGADEETLAALERLRARGMEVRRLSAGDSLEPLRGLALHVLHPGAGAAFEDANDYSLVLRAEYAGRTLLLTGDLTQAGEDFAPGRCDVLKVAHHGSAGSSSLEFLAEVNPALALISAAQRNSYGLPADALKARLSYIGARTLVTGECGDITVHIAPEGVMTVRTYLPAGDEAALAEAR